MTKTKNLGLGLVRPTEDNHGAYRYCFATANSKMFPSLAIAEQIAAGLADRIDFYLKLKKNNKEQTFLCEFYAYERKCKVAQDVVRRVVVELLPKCLIIRFGDLAFTSGMDDDKPDCVLAALRATKVLRFLTSLFSQIENSEVEKMTAFILDALQEYWPPNTQNASTTRQYTNAFVGVTKGERLEVRFEKDGVAVVADAGNLLPWKDSTVVPPREALFAWLANTPAYQVATNWMI